MFDPARVHRVAAQSDALPWYADRNDQRLATDAGSQSPSMQQSATFTSDQQYQTGGRVRDYYNSTTYRYNYTQGTR